MDVIALFIISKMLLMLMMVDQQGHQGSKNIVEIPSWEGWVE